MIGKAPCEQTNLLDSFYWQMLRKLKAFTCIKLKLHELAGLFLEEKLILCQ